MAQAQNTNHMGGAAEVFDPKKYRMVNANGLPISQTQPNTAPMKNGTDTNSAPGSLNRLNTGGGAGQQAPASSSLSEIEALYRQQYDLRAQQRKRQLDATLKANNDAADRNLNEAYIQYMLSQKNLPQQLRANGINGGATETVLGDMNNTYMNARNTINTNRDDANLKARLAYDSGVAGDYNNLLTNQINLKLANLSNTGGSSSSRSRSTSTKTTSTSDDYSGALGDKTATPTTSAPNMQQFMNLYGTVANLNTPNPRVVSAEMQRQALEQREAARQRQAAQDMAAYLTRQGYTQAQIYTILKRQGLVE